MKRNRRTTDNQLNMMSIFRVLHILCHKIRIIKNKKADYKEKS